jgi:hypothetical protein
MTVVRKLYVGVICRLGRCERLGVLVPLLIHLRVSSSGSVKLRCTDLRSREGPVAQETSVAQASWRQIVWVCLNPTAS